MNRLDAIKLSQPKGSDAGGAGLLGAGDPDPVEIRHAQSPAPMFLLCEHAGRAVPRALNGLGLPAGAIDGHIGWDIGAASLACAISDRLRCPLILQNYSRLVMDCNRPPLSAGSVPVHSDGVGVPGNLGLGKEDHDHRRQAIFDPMNDAIVAMFDAHPRKAVFSIHSYTRHFQGAERPWDAGFLTRDDTEAAHHLMGAIATAAPELKLAINEPYQIDDESDWFIPRHAEVRGMRHTLIEVRNDHLQDHAGIERWADLLAPAIQTVLERTA
ncbi:N-formylglutamate amidohydrolase [Sulfitobacter sp. S190]|uniref:N-formylglutamate amidohydrolase n=1 Tax=Sulfitobacter sp. S190 TaxID=2867022 RepID=UPI0021A51053|nr:N-formylglutamate amidohydrolase [Sulfitobacter sp. S190]UWR22139.1 N-formylglutamate amidohydrolase [Sulfitobacter sp. S190]